MKGFPSFGLPSIKTIDRSSLFRKESLEMLNPDLYENEDLWVFFPPEEERILQVERLIDAQIEESEEEFTKTSKESYAKEEENFVLLAPIIDPIETSDFVQTKDENDLKSLPIDIIAFNEEIFDYIEVHSNIDFEKEKHNFFIQYLQIPRPFIDTYLAFSIKQSKDQNNGDKQMNIEVSKHEYQPENSSPLTKSDFISDKTQQSQTSKEVPNSKPTKKQENEKQKVIKNEIQNEKQNPSKQIQIEKKEQNAKEENSKKKLEKQKTIEETIGMKKSSLFPRTKADILAVKEKYIQEKDKNENSNETQSKAITYIDPKDFKYAFVCDNSYLEDEDFKAVFSSDCRVAARTLYDWDFELSPTHCVIIYDPISNSNSVGPLSTQTKNKDRNIAKSLSNALSVFTHVTLFKVGHIKAEDDLFLSLCNCERANVRHVPYKAHCYMIMKNSLLSNESYITSQETLHEYFYSQFSCVPHIVAMKWLSKGNPMTNMRVVDRNEPSGHMLSVVLDSRPFIQRVTNPSVKRTEALCKPIAKIKSTQRKKATNATKPKQKAEIK